MGPMGPIGLMAADSGIADVFAGFHFVGEDDVVGGVLLDHFFHELEVDSVVLEDCKFVEAFKFKGDEEWPFVLGIDLFAALYREDLGDFEQDHPCVHHHFLELGRSHLRTELEQFYVMDHAGNGCRECRVRQARIIGTGPGAKMTQGTKRMGMAGRGRYRKSKNSVAAFAPRAREVQVQVKE